MKQKTRRILCIIVVFALLFSLISCNPADTKDTDEPETTSAEATQETKTEEVQAEETANPLPEYLNFDSELPIVKEGFDTPITIAAKQDASWGNDGDVWFWEYVRQAMNIDLELIQVQELDTYKATSFAGNDLPDAFVGFGFSTSELVTYGQQEGQLIDILPWVNDTYMPYLNALFVEQPAVKSLLLASDGGMYSFGQITGSNYMNLAGGMWPMFVNTVWLEEEGLESPENLDEFIEMLQAFKNRGEDIVPLGGTAEYQNPGKFILLALGYNTTDSWGLTPSLRNGEAAIPAGDPEAFGAYLTFMNQLYTEGLIEQDFFTLDKTTVEGKMAENKYGAYGFVPFLQLPETFSEWWAVAPMTSELNETKIFPSRCPDVNADSLVQVGTGGFVITSECEYTDVMVRFADWFYEPTSYNYNLSVFGPTVDMVDEIGYGLTGGWEMNPETLAYQYVDAEDSSQNYPYMCAHVFGIHAGQGLGNGTYYAVVNQVIAGLESDVTTLDVPLDITVANDHSRLACMEMDIPYIQTMYPPVTFFSAEDTQAISDYQTLISDYVKQETAKFITGLRPLGEIEDYFAELDAMGFQEWQKYYIDYYNNFLGNQ